MPIGSWVSGLTASQSLHGMCAFVHNSVRCTNVLIG